MVVGWGKVVMGIGQPELGRSIARIGYGSDEHFKRVYDEYGPRLLAICTKIIGNQALAEVALKNCFVTVWHTASSFQDTELEPEAWLMSIARKEAFAMAADKHGSIDTPEEHVHSEVYDVVAKSGLAEHFRDGFDHEETEEARQGFNVMKLIHNFGLTYRKAARCLGVDHNELKATVHRELLKVRGL